MVSHCLIAIPGVELFHLKEGLGASHGAVAQKVEPASLADTERQLGQICRFLIRQDAESGRGQTRPPTTFPLRGREALAHDRLNSSFMSKGSLFIG